MANERPWGLGDADELGTFIRQVREVRQLTQEDLAALMRALGLDTTREQVVRMERGQRSISAVELYTVARALTVPVSSFYRAAGFIDGVALLDETMFDTTITPFPLTRELLSHVADELSPAARALIGGDTLAAPAVQEVLAAWIEYEQRSGRDPTPHAQRAKHASLWGEYTNDPVGFRVRAFGDQADERDIEQVRQGEERQ